LKKFFTKKASLKINQLNSSLTTTTTNNTRKKLVNYTHTHTRNYALKEELYNNKLFESEGLRERKSANNEEEEE